MFYCGLVVIVNMMGAYDCPKRMQRSSRNIVMQFVSEAQSNWLLIRTLH